MVKWNHYLICEVNPSSQLDKQDKSLILIHILTCPSQKLNEAFRIEFDLVFEKHSLRRGF